MNDRLSRDDMLSAISVIVSKRSSCQRLQVGAVIAVSGRILSTGYAGAPSGFPHCSELICDLSKPCIRTVHAEANAIAFSARNGISIQFSTLYTTHSPCWDCAKLIVNAGIIRVVYMEEYRLKEPLDLLRTAGIKIERWEIPEWVPE